MAKSYSGDFNAKININKQEATQNTSPNGKLLEKMIANTGLHVMNLKAYNGNWTRVNRKRPDEKSIIDYILTTGKTATEAKDINIDENGTMRMKGKEDSDHNTITMTTKLECKNPPPPKKTIWKINNKEGWKEYNRRVGELETDNLGYDQ